MGILDEVNRLTQGRGIASKKEDKIRIDADVKGELERRKAFFSSDKKISYSNTISKCLDLLNEIENIVDNCDGDDSANMTAMSELYALFNGSRK
jgi:hypothetical protein